VTIYLIILINRPVLGQASASGIKHSLSQRRNTKTCSYGWQCGWFLFR